MATWQIHGTCALLTTFEGEGRLRIDDADDFNDDSYFSTEEIRAEGSFDFEVTASSEDDARNEAETLLDNLYFQSDNDWEWEVLDREITDVEKTSSMTLAEAVEALDEYKQGLEGDVREAVETVLDTIVSLQGRISSLEEICRTLREEAKAASETPFVAGEAPAEPVSAEDDRPPFGSDESGFTRV